MHSITFIHKNIHFNHILNFTGYKDIHYVTSAIRKICAERHGNYMHFLSEYIDAIPDLSEKEKARLTYFFACIIYEGSKLILFFIYFGMTHNLKSFCYSLMILLPLRIISGGLHFKHYYACLLFSFGYFYFVNIILSEISLSLPIGILLLCICIVINSNTGPIVSDSRPALTPERIKKSRQRITIVTIYEAMLTIIFYDTPLATVGLWTIVLHSLQLMIANFRKKRGENDVQAIS